MSLSPSVKSAQDAARQTTGEFGTQTHHESGIFPAPAVSRLDPDRVIAKMATNYDYADGFDGFEGEGFRTEVQAVAIAISDLEKGMETPLVFIADEEYSSDQIGFELNGYQVTQVLKTWDAVTTDHDATGTDAARAIVAGITATRDAMVTDFRTKMAASLKS